MGPVAVVASNAVDQFAEVGPLIPLSQTFCVALGAVAMSAGMAVAEEHCPSAAWRSAPLPVPLLLCTGLLMLALGCKSRLVALI